MGILTYSTNNSGGGWWLEDEDWKALEKAGWKVFWMKGREDAPKNEIGDEGEVRWLGALAKECAKVFDNSEEGISEFERVAHQSASDCGCECCGAPHSFQWAKTATQEHLDKAKSIYDIDDTDYLSVTEYPEDDELD